MSSATLYSYFRSSCSWRVRIALAYKGIPYNYHAVNLLKSEQTSEEYAQLNSLKEVPTLVIDGRVLTQSMAILEYLEETHPEPALLPKDPLDRAQVRGLCYAVAMDTQPIQNLRVLNYVGDEKKGEWAKHWIEVGFDGLEKALMKTSGKYSFGDQVTLADLCLVPQMFNAKRKRFNVDVSKYPTILRIVENLESLDAFKTAHPSVQPDAPVA